MPVSSKPPHSGGDQCGPGPPNRNKRPRSQLSSGPNAVNRSHVVSPPGWERPPLYIGGASVTGPSINIPDTRYGFSSPRPARYGQVSQPSPLHLHPTSPLSTLPLSVSAFLIPSLTALQAVEGGSALHNSCGGIYREVQTLNRSSALLYRLSLDVCLLPWPLTIFLIGSSQAPTLIFPASAPPSPLPPQRSPWESHSNHDVHSAI